MSEPGQHTDGGGAPHANATVPGALPSHSERLATVSAPGWLDSVFTSLRERSPRLFIGNEWMDATGSAPVNSHDPSTGEVIAQYAQADASDVDRAVTAAKRAQPGWAGLTWDQRASYVAALADVIAAHSLELAAVDAIDAGLPLRGMFGDIDGIMRALRGWPALAASLRGQVLEGASGLHFTRYCPFGVVGKITAYNHPILFAVKGSLAPLMAGNCVVLKPSDQAPMSTLLLCDLVREVLPAGVFNVVTGDAATGNALVTHRDIRRVAFTGSVRTGQLIQQAAARDSIRSVSLELGGKNAMIVFPDASVKEAARNEVVGMNLRANGGQSCGSTSRVLVHRDVYDEFVTELAEQLSGLKVGRAYEPAADMGPLIDRRSVERIQSYVRIGTGEGATLVTGDQELAMLPEGGNYVAPVLFRDVAPSSRLATEEIFGPVISVIPWDDYDTMLGVANDCTDLGLTASVWTNDLTTALKTVDRLQTGYVWINESTTHHFGTPFGGWKNSGLGREESMEELLGYLQMKSVHVKLA